MTRDELEHIITDYMDGFTTMTVACSRGDKPWAAAVYYARIGFDLVFFSSPSSRHCTALADNPEAAATIQGNYKGWKEIKGLQIEGRVERVVSAADRAAALATFFRRHAFVSEFFSDPLSIGVQTSGKMSRVNLYIFRPRTILYINNEAGFGTRWKLEIHKGKTVGDPTLI
jgi:uncharacterized protein